MKAAAYHRYGNWDELKIIETEKPVPKPNEILIRVRAVAINDWDWQLLLGIPFANRMINGLFHPKLKILGSDVAGTIEAVGSKVTQFKIGDAVYGDLSNRWGGFADYVCASQKQVVLKPATMSFEQAAAIPQAGMLAVQGLIDTGRIEPNEYILINGAGGGVGTFGIQIAKMHGASATGVDSSEKIAMLQQLGFAHTIDYTKDDFTNSGQKYDLILDTKTNRSIFRYLKSLKPGGRYVTVGGSTLRLLQIFLLGPLIGLVTGKRFRLVVLKINKDLQYMSEQFEAGTVIPVIDRTYPLDEMPQAMKYYGEGRQKGKIVILAGTP
jgi:NADPH:quinone reductase-like Zn-dependent oxidoreductase